MRAIVATQYGPPSTLVVQEVAKPTPGAGEVLVRVRASTVAGDDWHLVRGLPYVARLATGLRRPKDWAPGLDLAGTVEGARTSGVVEVRA